MDKTLKLLIIAVSAVSVLNGCTPKRITRLDTDVTIDLSGRWNDTDSRLVSEALTEQALDAGWYRHFKERKKRKPTVIVGAVNNKTYEHINVETFVKDLERAMLNSGHIDIAASKEERKEVRQERKEMRQWASIESRKEFGRETGADYMLKGVINSILDEEGGKKIVYYQIDLNLINLESNKIVWAGQKKIKKFIKRPVFKF